MFNEDNISIMDALKKVDPKRTENFFHENELVKKFVENDGGGIDIMKQPVCEKCERPGTWSKTGGYCFSCNHTTKEPKKVEEYLIEMLDGLDIQMIKMVMKGIENEKFINGNDED